VVSSFISLNISWKLTKAVSLVVIYFNQQGLNSTPGLYIADIVVILKTFVNLNSSWSNIAVVNNTGTVMCLEKLYLYSISLVFSIEIDAKPKTFASFYNELLENRYRA
jgi:hypothetical protein